MSCLVVVLVVYVGGKSFLLESTLGFLLESASRVSAGKHTRDFFRKCGCTNQLPYSAYQHTQVLELLAEDQYKLSTAVTGYLDLVALNTLGNTPWPPKLYMVTQAWFGGSPYIFDAEVCSFYAINTAGKCIGWVSTGKCITGFYWKVHHGFL